MNSVHRTDSILDSSRREFMRTAFAATVLSVAGGVPTLLGEVFPDDFKERGGKLTGIFTMKFSEFPVLRSVGGSVRLQVPGAPLSLGQIIITRYGQNSFSALSEMCTHEGCPVGNFVGNRFSCACHGSVFDAQGKVLQGPAQHPLPSFTTTYKQGDDFVLVEVPGLATSVKGDNQTNFSLSQNYPNPASGQTTIEYGVAKESMVSIAIFSLLGKEVAEIVRREHEAGQYRVVADISGLNKGVYFYRMDTSGGFSQTRKLTVV